MDTQLRMVIYDVEVFLYDWIVVFKDVETEEFTVIHNDPDLLDERISEDELYIGFNSKFYDQAIIRGIVCGFSHFDLKELSNRLIQGELWWNIDELMDRNFYIPFKNVDLRDDMQMGLSLKSIEAHLGMDIEESSVDFLKDEPLDTEEIIEVIEYCKHDVNATHELFKLRKDYLENKLFLGQMVYHDNAEKALSLTNAKLTAELLGADSNLRLPNDERLYTYPSNLLSEYIPNEVFEFFNQLKDLSISDDDVFSSKLNIALGDCPITLGYGGIHGAINNYEYRKEKSI